MISVPDILKNYALHCAATHPASASIYLCHARSYLKNQSLDEEGLSELVTSIAAELAKGKGGSARVKRSYFRAFCNWLVTQGLLPFQPSSPPEVKFPREKFRTPPPASIALNWEILPRKDLMTLAIGYVYGATELTSQGIVTLPLLGLAHENISPGGPVIKAWVDCRCLYRAMPHLAAQSRIPSLWVNSPWMFPSQSGQHHLYRSSIYYHLSRFDRVLSQPPKAGFR